MSEFIPKSKIFICVLNMGLGHASRSLPVIQDLQKSGARIVVGSSGRSLLFLKQEVNEAEFLELPDYELSYSNRGVNIIQLIQQIPGLMKKINLEHKIVRQTVADHSINLIISDHRYGCYCEEIPSLFITHQLRFIAPPFLRFFEFIGVTFNRYYHAKYDTVIVPDLLHKNEGLLSGRLSRVKSEAQYFFPGTLSSILNIKYTGDKIDLLVSISGPESQRSVFEKIIRSQIQHIKGNKVILLGKPEVKQHENLEKNLTIISHASRQDISELYSRAKLIITRSGYSTIMELAETDRKALFVPTPGQTEQLYLAQRFKKNGWFYCVDQEKLDLKTDVGRAQEFSGFPGHYSTKDSVGRIRELVESRLVQVGKK
jgi:uncharacterized protein (TIGR00661 family)